MTTVDATTATGGDIDSRMLAPTFRVLLGYVRPHQTALVVGGLLRLATTATGLALPRLSSWTLASSSYVDSWVFG
jgi:hypothetical protein